MNWKYCILVILLCMAITFIVADKFYWTPRMEAIRKIEKLENYYIIDYVDPETFLKWRQVVEILTSDLYRQGYISWDADILLKDLDKEYQYGQE